MVQTFPRAGVTVVPIFSSNGHRSRSFGQGRRRVFLSGWPKPITATAFAVKKPQKLMRILRNCLVTAGRSRAQLSLPTAD